MLDFVILLAQGVSVLFLAAWLTLGAANNLRHPDLNEVFTAEVMSLARMKLEYPDEYARIAHRAVNSRSLQRAAFRLAVTAEVSAMLVLWAGAGMMALALFGAAAPETARAVALLGALMFTAVWAGFLIVGEYFAYWFCHPGAQATHYMMTLWGIGTMILLAIA